MTQLNVQNVLAPPTLLLEDRTMRMRFTLALALTVLLAGGGETRAERKDKKKPKDAPAAEQPLPPAAEQPLPPAAEQPLAPSPLAEGVKLALAKQWDEAIAKLQSVTEENKKPLAERAVFTVQALQAYEQGRYGDAVKLFAEAANRSKGFIVDELWVNAALQDVANAKPLIDHCAGQASRRAADTLARLGQAKEAQVIYAKLAKYFEQRYEAAGRPAAMLPELADLCERAGDVDGAATVHESMTQDTDKPEPWIEMAAFWQRQGKPARVKGCMDTALELCDPKDIVKIKSLKALRDGNWGERGQPKVAASPAKPQPLALDASTMGARLPPVYTAPSGDQDQYCNPVVTRNGQRVDPDSGLPYETWLSWPAMEFVLIPAGVFTMGSREQDDEKPQHKVRVSKAFYLGKYEVSVAQFQEFTKATGYRTEAEAGDGAYAWNGKEWKNDPNSNWKQPGFTQTPNDPVVCVSWNDAQAFCKWAGVRRPTEAQWEYACRAGTQTRFSSGDRDEDLKDYAWYTENSGQKTQPVGKKRANLWGLYDMHGNVWEWCQDWYGGDYYAKSPGVDPTGPAEGKSRVLRGGSWDNSPQIARSANRNGYGPDDRNTFAGFRVVVACEWLR